MAWIRDQEGYGLHDVISVQLILGIDGWTMIGMISDHHDVELGFFDTEEGAKMELDRLENWLADPYAYPECKVFPIGTPVFRYDFDSEE